MHELELEKKVSCVAVDYDSTLESVRRIEYHSYRHGIPCAKRYGDNKGMFEERLQLTDFQGHVHVVEKGTYVVFYPHGHGFVVVDAKSMYDTFAVLTEENS